MLPDSKPEDIKRKGIYSIVYQVSFRLKFLKMLQKYQKMLQMRWFL